MTTPTIVSGGLSSWSELGQDEAFLRDWLMEQPRRLGLGELTIADGDPVRDDEGNPAFIADDDDRYYSVDVRLAEMDASVGFALLDNWARNRVRHLDKTHVAVLVTENVGDRYRATLETLTEHLPLVVVELQVWRGENEAILVPHVALASAEVDLSGTPAARAAEAASVATEASGETAEAAPESEAADEAADVAAFEEAVAGDEVVAETPESDESGDAVEVDKDHTGVVDPWGTAAAEPQTADEDANGSRVLSNIGG